MRSGRGPWRRRRASTSVNALDASQAHARLRAIVHDFCDPFFNTVARGVTNAAEAAATDVVCDSSRDPDKERAYVQLAREQRVAGVLFVGGA